MSKDIPVSLCFNFCLSHLELFLVKINRSQIFQQIFNPQAFFQSFDTDLSRFHFNENSNGLNL